MAGTGNLARCCFKIKVTKGLEVRRWGSGVGCLPSICQAQGSIPSTIHVLPCPTSIQRQRKAMQIFLHFPQGHRDWPQGCYSVLCPSSSLCHTSTSPHVSEDTGFSTGALGRDKDWTFPFHNSFQELNLRKLLNSLRGGREVGLQGLFYSVQGLGRKCEGGRVNIHEYLCPRRGNTASVMTRAKRRRGLKAKGPHVSDSSLFLLPHLCYLK